MSRFFKFFMLDIREGWRRSLAWWLVAAGVFLILPVAFYLSTLNLRAEGIAAQFTLGDYYFNLTAGGLAYDPTSSTPFTLPISWFAPILLLAYITLWYPYHDLMGSGKTMMIASGSRWSWWLAKCAWIIVYVCIYCLIGFVLTTFFALIIGCDHSFIATDTSALLLRFDSVINFDVTSYDIVSFLYVVPVVLCALCMLQLAISLLFRPLWGYVVTISILFVSAFSGNHFLLGNSLMAIRSTVYVADGVSPLWSTCLGLIVIVASVVIGGYFLTKTDILEKEA